MFRFNQKILSGNNFSDHKILKKFKFPPVCFHIYLYYHKVKLIYGSGYYTYWLQSLFRKFYNICFPYMISIVFDGIFTSLSLFFPYTFSTSLSIQFSFYFFISFSPSCMWVPSRFAKNKIVVVCVFCWLWVAMVWKSPSDL